MFTIVITSIEVYRSRSVDVTKTGCSVKEGEPAFGTLNISYCVHFPKAVPDRWPVLECDVLFLLLKVCTGPTFIVSHKSVICNASTDLSLAAATALGVMHLQ